jgi:peroxiredoxin
MARAFDDGSSQYLENTVAAPVTDFPFTMACWFNSDDITVAQTLVHIQDKDVADAYHGLFAQGAVAGDPIRAATVGGTGGTVLADTTAGYSANTWHHACGVWATRADVSSFIDGGSEGNDGGAGDSPPGIDSVSLGRQGDSTPGTYMSGNIAEAAIWNAALTNAEVAILATGVSPLAVRPQSLVFYMPLVRDDDVDLIGGLTLTPSGSPTIADHPPVQKLGTPPQYDFGYISHHARLGWRNQHQILRFDANTRKHTIFRARLPQQYAGNGIELNLHYSMATAIAGNVKWGAAFERIPDSGLDIDGDDFAPFNYRDIEVPAVSGNVGIAKIRFIHGTDMDSVIAGDLFRVKIIRDAEADVATGDAELHTVEVREL